MAPEVRQCTISHFLQVGPELVNTTANLSDSRSLTRKKAVEQIGRYLKVSGE